MRHRTTLFLLVATLLVYARVVTFDFIDLDDATYLGHPALANGNLLALWTAPYFRIYHPLTFTVWSFVAFLSRSLTPSTPQNPAFFHAANLLVHSANVILVFHFLRYLLRLRSGSPAEPSPIPAALGALLFAVHPAQVEAVSWVSDLKDPLYAFFGIAALWFFALSREARTPPAGTSRERRKRAKREEGERTSFRPYYGLALVAFTLSLLSKPSAVALAPLLLVIDRCFCKASWKLTLRDAAVFSVLCLPIIIVNKRVQPDGLIHDVAPLLARPWIALDALAFYLYKLVCPLWPSIDYGRSPRFLAAHPLLYATGVAPLALGGLALALRKRQPWVLTATLIFLVSFLPVSGLVPFGYQQYSTVTDHYMYLAMLGPAFALASVLTLANTRPWLAVAGLALSGLALLTCLQLSCWKNSPSVFEQAFRLTRNSFPAHSSLACYLCVHGEYERSLEHCREALEVEPDALGPAQNMGINLFRLKRYPECAEHYARVLGSHKTEPDEAPILSEIYSSQGGVLAVLGRYPEAVTALEHSLALAPGNVVTENKLGLTFAASGKPREALPHLRLALEANPGDARIRASVEETTRAAGK